MDKDYSDWFATNAKALERAYLRGASPWERSGVGLHNQRDYEYWRAVRQPIAECIDRNGSVLDIGCANGFLLESLREWKREQGIELELFGLDISEKLLREARSRLHQSTFYCANVWGWKPPRKFDFVITELVYVPEEVRQFYLRGLLNEAVAAGGKLIVTQYS
ncbi:MAG TPA: class I SAM-dependent methyltransferase, partial [Candidatus Kapabacteria bacterium]|nr:class I SAM-dependent methyltransferase [Candidatus Kapabacteria bacterium]